MLGYSSMGSACLASLIKSEGKKEGKKGEEGRRHRLGGAVGNLLELMGEGR